MKHRPVCLALLLVTATAALAQSGPPVPAKNLKWEKTGEIVFAPVASAPANIKDGDKLNLVDASDTKVTGTGAVSRKSSRGDEWEVKVEAVRK